MGIHTISSREFNQDIGAAKRAEADGPVFVTDRGKPAHVLLTVELYNQLTGAGTKTSIADLLAMPTETGDFEFEAPAADLRTQPANLDG